MKMYIRKNMTYKFFALKVILIVSVALVYPVKAATELTYKDHTGEAYKVYLSQDRVGSHEGFYDLKKDHFVVIQHQNKTYSVISRQDIKSMIDQSKQMMSQIEGLSAYLPPEYQAQVQQAKPKTMQMDNVRLEERGQDKVAGYNCDKVRMMQGNQVKGEACIAKASELGLPGEDIASIKSSINTVRSLLEQVPGVTAQQQQQMLLFQEGIPLSLTTDQGESWVLTSVKAMNNSVHIPADYQQKKLNFVPGM